MTFFEYTERLCDSQHLAFGAMLLKSDPVVVSLSFAVVSGTHADGVGPPIPPERDVSNMESIIIPQVVSSSVSRFVLSSLSCQAGIPDTSRVG